MDNGRGSLHAGAAMAMRALWALQYIYSTTRSDVKYLRFSLIVVLYTMRSGGFSDIVHVCIRISFYTVVNSCAWHFAMLYLIYSCAIKEITWIYTRTQLFWYLWIWFGASISAIKCDLIASDEVAKVVRMWCLKLSCAIHLFTKDNSSSLIRHLKPIHIILYKMLTGPCLSCIMLNSLFIESCANATLISSIWRN